MTEWKSIYMKCEIIFFEDMLHIFITFLRFPKRKLRFLDVTNWIMYIKFLNKLFVLSNTLGKTWESSSIFQWVILVLRSSIGWSGILKYNSWGIYRQTHKMDYMLLPVLYWKCFFITVGFPNFGISPNFGRFLKNVKKPVWNMLSN